MTQLCLGLLLYLTWVTTLFENLPVEYLLGLTSEADVSIVRFWVECGVIQMDGFRVLHYILLNL